MTDRHDPRPMTRAEQDDFAPNGRPGLRPNSDGYDERQYASYPDEDYPGAGGRQAREYRSPATNAVREAIRPAESSVPANDDVDETPVSPADPRPRHRHPSEAAPRRIGGPVGAGRGKSLREVAAERRRASTRNKSVDLPVLGLTALYRTRTMEDILMTGNVPSDLTEAVNQVIRESDGINNAEFDMGDLFERILDGPGGVEAVIETASGLDEGLIIAGCIYPEFVESVDKITDPDRQLLVADLDEEDFDILAAAIGGGSGVRLAAFRAAAVPPGDVGHGPGVRDAAGDDPRPRS